MHFRSGVDIPDDLLLALDEGRVVFFCGAGVSRAKAGLPDFFGLAKRVFKRLRVLPEDPAAKVLCEAQKIEKSTGVPGLVAADRVFGLLENDFLKRDVERAVAQSLKLERGVDLSAHKLLLDLATTVDGQTKLVTTNFDRLFDDCGRDLNIWQPPLLPDPSRPGEMEGIVYLHGRATKTYDGSESDGFVLSSSDFGRAYLAEGWATSFVKEVIDRYVVVFVGYSADDPPVQYLLEALNKTPGTLRDVYAFQSGSHDQAMARWSHKGVTAIAYSGDDGHKALWETLAEWAQRAKSPVVWQDSVVDMAQKGPEKLSPVQREQVAHLVSTKMGARKFLECEPPPPATWLCVFDRTLRLDTGVPLIGGDQEYSDPFRVYALESDPGPERADSDGELYMPREVSPTAWDAFQLNRHDLAELADRNVTPLRDEGALNAAPLPDRINYLGRWIARVSNQGAAVWWAAGQDGLHPNVQRQIELFLDRPESKYNLDTLRTWHYLFEHWRSKSDSDQLDWYNFDTQLQRDGWDTYAVRKFEALSRPRMSVSRRGYHTSFPVDQDGKADLKRLVHFSVSINEERPEIEIPDEWLGEVLAACRRNLNVGIQLKMECGQYAWFKIPPIIASDDPDISGYPRSHGFKSAVLYYAKLFERLVENDLGKAWQEAVSWPIDDDSVYARLRIWACRFEDLVPGDRFQDFFAKVSRKAFWEEHHQRDLLLSLKKRWASLPESTRGEIEVRILEGSIQLEHEPDDGYVKYKAMEKIADRIHWFKVNGCALALDYEKKIEQLKADAPEWDPVRATDADSSTEPRGGIVHIETQPSELLDEPIPTILTKAQELRGSDHILLVTRDPFAGLCESRPVKALSALRHAARKGQFPQWDWHAFLMADARENDSDRTKNLVVEIVTAMPGEDLAGILPPVTHWLLTASKDMPEQCMPVFERLARHLVDILRNNPEAGNLAIEQGTRSTDWADEASNSPSGNIARALFNYPRIKELGPNHGLPDRWLALVESIMNLQSDAGRLALVFFARHLNWFYVRDSKWTDKHLISVLSAGDQKTVDAWWAGYLWSASLPQNFELFQKLKTHLLDKAYSDAHDVGENRDGLARIILASWGHCEPETDAIRISDQEFHKALLNGGDDFRSKVLWQLWAWCRKDSEGGQHWRQLRLRFLKDAWPTHLIAKTDSNSEWLIRLAFSDEETFLDVSEAILPLLCPMEGYNRPSLLQFDSIIQSHPERVLEILWAALPENAIKWPYETDDILERIGNANPALRHDERFIELNRRWNTR